MKRTVPLKLGEQTIEVVLHRHHWARRLTLSVKPGGTVRLSLPPRTPWRAAEAFLAKSRGWIEKQLRDYPVQERREPTLAERRRARQLIRYKLMQWQPALDAEAKKIRIGNQTSRWGSCSGKGTLSFNWRLSELPEPLVDYVVIHELAHLREANHSPRFWALVEAAAPNYRELRKELRRYGPIS